MKANHAASRAAAATTAATAAAIQNCSMHSIPTTALGLLQLTDRQTDREAGRHTVRETESDCQSSVTDRRTVDSPGKLSVWWRKLSSARQKWESTKLTKNVWFISSLRDKNSKANQTKAKQSTNGNRKGRQTTAAATATRTRSTGQDLWGGKRLWDRENGKGNCSAAGKAKRGALIDYETFTLLSFSLFN